MTFQPDIPLYLHQEDADSIEIFPLMSEPVSFGKDPFVFPADMAVLPVRSHVIFPGIVSPVPVGRDKSLRMIREMYKSNTPVVALTQQNQSVNDPQPQDLYSIGTVSEIVKILEMPDGSTSIILQGRVKCSIDTYTATEPWLKATVHQVDEPELNMEETEFSAIASSIKDLFLKISELSGNVHPEMIFMIRNSEHPSFLINFVSSNVGLKIADKQRLLESKDLKHRGILLMKLLQREIQFLELRQDIQSKVRYEMNQQQREYMLQQQIKTIQDELGGSPTDQEINELQKRAKKKQWKPEVKETFLKELEKLRRQNPAAADYSVQLNYIHTLLDLPWDQYTKDNFDLTRARKILDKDHTGLIEVKDRILEYLAVLKLKGDMKSPIICLVGPPGVGKTSLGKSVAKALDRKYVRMSLGGLHDEAEIRGHRKTYIGAMPGQVIQHIKKAGSSNPVFVLDEVDKMGQGINGDPSSALLEVLDPEQNNTFHDNFLELEYDLSRVLFIATANSLETIHPALLDRMEIIRVSGYVIEEKLEIAKRHLIPNQLKEHGMSKSNLSFSPKTIEYMIQNYTRESGVRQLDKTIARILRSTAKKVALGEPYDKKLQMSDLQAILGSPKFSPQKYTGNDFIGVVTGLAWTSAGGEILSIETSTSRGKGTLTLTGNLGDVMKESAIIALEYIKSHASEFELDPSFFEQWNIHIHVPEGAIPKDGPSAGITMATSLTSALTRRKVRKGIAMSGEITLTGRVLPVGGIKEKILAAKRAGITEIILSEENRQDIEEINALYLKGVTFIYVKEIKEVLHHALTAETV